jgi:hypothetical protein
MFSKVIITQEGQEIKQIRKTKSSQSKGLERNQKRPIRVNYPWTTQGTDLRASS